MKRLFALLLVCLLPMQVFAGMLTYRTAVDTVALLEQVAVAAALQAPAAAAQADADQALLADADSNDNSGNIDSVDNSVDNSDDDNGAYADSEDFSNHVGVGDEPVLNTVLAFVADSATLAPALRSDAASQPPFLPPAGRPPRG